MYNWYCKVTKKDIEELSKNDTCAKIAHMGNAVKHTYNTNKFHHAIIIKIIIRLLIRQDIESNLGDVSNEDFKLAESREFKNDYKN